MFMMKKSKSGCIDSAVASYCYIYRQFNTRIQTIQCPLMLGSLIVSLVQLTAKTWFIVMLILSILLCIEHKIYSCGAIIISKCGVFGSDYSKLTFIFIRFRFVFIWFEDLQVVLITQHSFWNFSCNFASITKQTIFSFLFWYFCNNNVTK